MTQQDSSSTAICTRDELVKFIGTVAYEIAAPGVAKAALLAAAKAAGWEDVSSSICAMHAAATAPPPAPPGSAKKSGKGKKALENGQAEDGAKETKERKPRKMTALNIFTTYVMDMIHKDANNPAFKLETTKVDAEGNTVPVRGGHMTFVSNCWKTLGESDKAEFSNIISPALDKINEVVMSGGAKPEIMSELVQHLQGSHQEDKLRKLIHQCVIASTGLDPTKSHGGSAPAATPAKEAGEDKKRKSKDKAPATTEKPAKKAKAEETKDDKADKKTAKKAKEEAERKAKEEAEKKRKQEEEEAARKKKEEEQESSEEESGDESGSEESGSDDESGSEEESGSDDGNSD